MLSWSRGKINNWSSLVVIGVKQYLALIEHAEKNSVRVVQGLNLDVAANECKIIDISPTSIPLLSE